MVISCRVESGYFSRFINRIICIIMPTYVYTGPSSERFRQNIFRRSGLLSERFDGQRPEDIIYNCYKLTVSSNSKSF